MEKNNKHLVYAGLAIIIVIAIALVVPHLKGSSAVAPTTDSAVTAVPSTPAPVASTDTAASLAAWNATLKQYQGTSIIFDDSCTATPAAQTFSKGQTLLLVNNDTNVHTIVFGTMSYSIGPRHYKTVYLNQSGNVSVSCDARTNAASVTVQ